MEFPSPNGVKLTVEIEIKADKAIETLDLFIEKLEKIKQLQQVISD